MNTKIKTPTIRTITDPRELATVMLEEARQGIKNAKAEIKAARANLKGWEKEEERLCMELAVLGGPNPPPDD